MSKILLVEDDPMIAEIYIKKFQLAGLDVVNAVTGKEVLRFVENDKFDLILLDMVIPEMSGMDVLRELKQSGNYSKDLRIIVFSNLNETDTQKEALELGADGFIGKTQYSPSEMVTQVQKLLNEYEEQKKNKARLNETEGIMKNGKKILFIEDEDIFLEMFGKKLENDGFTVQYAKNGAWGVKEAINGDYDVIITDMVMPAMGGIEIVNKLKQDEKTKNIPIIVLSASITDEDVQEVQNLGISEFILKTRVIPSELSRKVSDILKK